MKHRLLDMVVRPHLQGCKVIIMSFVIAVILLMLFPFLLTLTHPLVANYLHKELAYRHMSNKVTENCRNDFQKAVTLNSFIFLSEEQKVPFIGGVDNSAYFDLVRHIGWCDQKAGGLVHLLEKQNIKARIVMFPCHSVAEVWIDNSPRFFDPTFNCYFVYENNGERVATLEEVLNDNDRLIMNNGGSFSEYGGKCITTCENHSRIIIGSIRMDTKPLYKKMLSKAMDFYYYIGGDLFCDVFQDFFFVMGKLRGGKVVDFLGPIKTSQRILKEYESETYFTLYEARSRHLFNDFSKANRLYDRLLDSKNFRDDALFFKTKILVQTRNFKELRGFIMDIYDEYGEDIASKNRGAEIAYLFFIERYLEKFCLVENWQLENIFGFSEPEINEVKRIYEECCNTANYEMRGT